MTFSLDGNSIPTDGSGRVLITDINPNGYNDEDTLNCTSEIVTGQGASNWFLHPTEMSTNGGYRIDPMRVSKTMLSRFFDISV